MIMLAFLVGAFIGYVLGVRMKAPTVRLARQIKSKTLPKGAILETDKSETDEWLEAIAERKEGKSFDNDINK